MSGELRQLPGARKPHHLAEEHVVERGALGGRLNFDDAAGAGQHEIRVGKRLRIFGVVEIEHRSAGNDAAGDRGDACRAMVIPAPFRMRPIAETPGGVRT